MIDTDICIIGAGPAGMFAVFEAGLLKMRCHVIDSLPQPGGQLSEIYPKKPIYDIPGYPVIYGQDLVTRLMEQIAPFQPGFTLGERVEKFSRQHDGSMLIATNNQTVVHCKVLVIAAGLGCFEPRKPAINRLMEFEGRGVDYIVKDPEIYASKRIVIAGGGDSALDWTLFLSAIASHVTLVHRGNTFRGAPDVAEKVFKLAKLGKIDLILQTYVTGIAGNDQLENVRLKDSNGEESIIPADHLIPLFGLSPQLGPILNWGLNVDRSAILVNPMDYSTGVERIYAIGDINSYPGKLKLILSGFHEAALMVQSAFRYVFPDAKLNFKYTTVYGIPII